jgi:hypothetical protein
MGKLHDSQQEELLAKLAGFYKKRYANQSDFETKFNDAAEDLINTGDIERTVYLTFCTENDIEPKFKKKKPGGFHQEPSSSSSYTSSGCGGGGGYSSSRC